MTRTNAWNRYGKQQHQEEIKKTIDYLRTQGYHVVDLKNKSPDAIATKDGKLFAIEVLGRIRTKKNDYKNNFTYRDKLRAYSMFDFVILRIFNRERPTSTDETRMRILSTTTTNK